MSSFGVQLPLSRDSADGFTSLKSIKRTISQNLKMLILTNPGERIMDVEYGVGLKRYLFSSKTDLVQSQIEEKVREQVLAYLPVVSIREIRFRPDPHSNTLGISIIYEIPDIGANDIIEFAL
jgi:hypothetical protein